MNQQDTPKKLIFTLDQLTEEYGMNLEEMYRQEKFLMIEAIAMYIGQREKGKARNHIITTVTCLCNRLDTDKQEALLDSLVAQVRNKVWKQ